MGRYNPNVNQVVSQEGALDIAGRLVNVAIAAIAVRAIYKLIKDIRQGKIFAGVGKSPKTPHNNAPKVVESVLERIERLTKKVEAAKGSYLPRSEVCVDLLSGSSAAEIISDAQRKLQVAQRLTATLRILNGQCVALAQRMEKEPDLIHSQEHADFNVGMMQKIKAVMGKTDLFGVTIAKDATYDKTYEVRKSTDKKTSVGLPTGEQSGTILQLVAELMRTFSMWPLIDETTEIFHDSALAITFIGERALNDGCHQLLDLVEASVN